MGVIVPEPKLFTVHEAERVVEQIRPLVGRMVQAFAEMRAEIDAATEGAGVPPQDPELTDRLESRGVAPRLLEEINGAIQDIQSHGCVVNGPEAGLIDFPCLMGGEIVFLCWKYGESNIGHYHRIPDGFAGRKSLLDSSVVPEAESRPH